MSDLKRCPFCGDTYINIRHKEEGYNVGCNTVNCIACHVRTRVYKTEQEAIEAWNRREEAVTSPLLTEKWKRQHMRGEQDEQENNIS